MSDVSLLFRILQRAQGRRTVDLYRKRRRTQWSSRDVVRQRQFDTLRKLLVHTAEHVPYYRELFSRFGIRVDAIQDFNDFARIIPTINKGELRRNLPRLHADDADRRLIIHRTGGSSGQPLAFPRDRLSVAAFWADYLLTRSWWGVRSGDASAKIWGHYHAPETWAKGLVEIAKEQIKRRALNMVFISAYELSEVRMTRFAQQLQRLQPASIYGYASALETFSRFVDERGLDLELPGTDVVISTSEPLFEEQRQRLRRAFGCGVANEYGSCETGLIGFECPAGRMHLLEDTTLVEVVDDEGTSLEEGLGEIVVTSLLNRSVPLIRYRLGDVGRLELETCSCGRGGRLLQAVEGRIWSMLSGVNGAAIYPQIITQIVFKEAPEVRRFQAVQDHLDHVTIKLASSRAIAPEKTQGIIDELTRMMGPGTRVDVSVMEEIAPEPSGKFVPVKSLIGAQEGKRSGK